MHCGKGEVKITTSQEVWNPIIKDQEDGHGAL